MIPEAALWAIFLLPFLSFAVISFFLRPFLGNRPRLSGYVTILSIGASFALSLWALLTRPSFSMTWIAAKAA